jgi:ribosomal protein S18 acetylase RimI-like enzyme
LPPKEFLRRSIKNSQTSYFLTLTGNLPSAYHREPDVEWFITGVNFPMFNGVHITNFETDSARRVKETLEYFKMNKVPMYWWVDSSSSPGNLVEHLEREGLQHSSSDLGMAVDIAGLKGGDKLSSELEIRLVEDDQTMEEWMKVLSTVFQLPLDGFDKCLNLFNQGLSKKAKFQHFIGLLGKTPVATSSILYDSEICGIYDVATVQEARGRGIGRMMTVLPLLEARQKGYGIAVLQSSKMGRNVYASIGFEVIGELRTYYKNYSILA